MWGRIGAPIPTAAGCPPDDGYVFESEEPWAWATYHYGNWMPTSGYGWVWSPGRTWYPSTVEWRTTPETEPADNSYVGWAPIPPPDYVPPQSGYAPAGYYSGMPVDNLLTSPFWVFAQAASFLLGFGQPYTPAYSYLYQPCLAPPAYVPVFFGQTVFVPGYYAPSYYPPTYFGRGFVGAYSYGPPANYISRVTNINPTVYQPDHQYNTSNITRFHNVMAPPGVLSRQPRHPEYPTAGPDRRQALAAGPAARPTSTWPGRTWINLTSWRRRECAAADRPDSQGSARGRPSR